MKNILSILKVVVKYGAFIAVAIKVIQYAHDEFAKVINDSETPKNTEKDGEIVSEQS
ncbi:MAG: hypothetical protein ABIP27_19195 [Flavobacterium circumlabens]|uniref:hypothetical protein n=1 Tax=Flavobacterium circumlabens TaxID=2133765 RepID=UPI003266BC76